MVLQMQAYAGVIYLRVFTKDEISLTRFVASKTRVAPLNERKIPRLELLACLILSQLMKVVLESLSNLLINRVFCWTDSKYCVFWINRTEKLWERFVQNRVIEIRTMCLELSGITVQERRGVKGEQRRKKSY